MKDVKIEINDRLLPVGAVAEVLGITGKCVRDMILSGKLDAIDVSCGKQNKYYRVKESSLQRLVGSNVASPARIETPKNTEVVNDMNAKQRLRKRGLKV
jgi:hypothetical protein